MKYSEELSKFRSLIDMNFKCKGTQSFVWGPEAFALVGE